MSARQLTMPASQACRVGAMPTALLAPCCISLTSLAWRESMLHVRGMAPFESRCRAMTSCSGSYYVHVRRSFSVPRFGTDNMPYTRELQRQQGSTLSEEIAAQPKAAVCFMTYSSYWPLMSSLPALSERPVPIFCLYGLAAVCSSPP